MNNKFRVDIMTTEITELFRMNAEFLQNLMAQQSSMMKELVTEVQGRNRDMGGGGGGGGAYPDERRFKNMEVFGGKEEQYREWAMKFKAKVKEYSPEMHNVVMKAEEETEEIDPDLLDEQSGKFSTILYNRLTMLTSGPAFVIHQSVKRENGLESWRRLAKRYNPMTPMRGLQLMLKVMVPGKAKKGADIQSMISKWEGSIHTLERDYNEKISEMAKIGVLISMVPDDLQDVILQHADRLKEYRLVKEKVITLVDARERLRDPDAMDVGQVYRKDGEDDDDDGEDIAAVGVQCHGCGGWGHFRRECPSSWKGGKAKGKGKGEKGKGKGTLDKGKGKGFDGKGGKGGVRVPCPGCGKMGHTASSCWTLNPNLIPWKTASALDYDEGQQTEREIGQLDVAGDTREWELVQHKVNGKNDIVDRDSRQRKMLPPGLCGRNRFEALSVEEAELEVLFVDVEVEEKPVAHVQKTGKLVPAGRGKITIDSGAAESVMPKDMLPNEPAVEGKAKKNGVRYVAANGAKMENMGEKKAKFKIDGSQAVNGITFQVTDVSKPLASVSRILDKGNRVVFSRGPEGSYIENEVTGEWMPIKEERGTFVIEVDWLEPEVVSVAAVRASGFPRQGQ